VLFQDRFINISAGEVYVCARHCRYCFFRIKRKGASDFSEVPLGLFF
jgi:2-iminoacetate synthase ThiH